MGASKVWVKEVVLVKYHKKPKKLYGTEITTDVSIAASTFLWLVQMHIIKKEVNGGLGIEENIVTLCPECHYQEDHGLNTQLYEDYIENYLKGIYGANWNKEKLIYKKY